MALLNLVNLLDPAVNAILIALLLLLLVLIGSLPPPGRRPIQEPCRLHLWDVRQRRYVCRRCGFVPGQGSVEVNRR